MEPGTDHTNDSSEGGNKKKNLHAETLFVDIIVPLGIPNKFTYRVPVAMNNEVAVGKRVLVQFGKSKIYTGILYKIHNTAPVDYTVKYIESVLDDHPIVTAKQLQFWDWLSFYYCANPGDVMNAALPSGLKLSSSSHIQLNPGFNFEETSHTYFTDREHVVLDALHATPNLSFDNLSEILKNKTVQPIVNNLLKKNAVVVYEEVKDKYKPKLQAFVKLNEATVNNATLHEVLNQLEKKAYKQAEALLYLLHLSKTTEQGSGGWIKKSELLKKSETSTISALVKKSILLEEHFEVGRLLFEKGKSTEKKLSASQASAYQQVKNHFAGNKPVLLHGVTGSGKTEVYIQLIKDALSRNKQVLFLIPEIALTTQLITRLRAVFGEIVGVYHSRFSENERVETWNNVLTQGAVTGQQEAANSRQEAVNSGQEAVNSQQEAVSREQKAVDSKQSAEDNREEGVNSQEEAAAGGQEAVGKTQNMEQRTPNYRIILGARSGLFLPFTDLGLVIIDEEHDNSFKQYDPSPRYHARDAALYLATLHNAQVLLGTATPSVESFYNAQQNKYALVELKNQFVESGGTRVEICDVKHHEQTGQMKTCLTMPLFNAVEEALSKKKQVILFQNRRGFAPYTECKQCGHVPQCVQCDVSLIYHKHLQKLTCHYCGYSVIPPKTCSACGSNQLFYKGLGTEKVEEDIQILFPNAKVARMDLDSTRSKYAYKQLIDDFEAGNIDILVGTQMVTKGLDFDNVSVVGVLNADSSFNFPDFRSFEKSFQLITQVRGRAGRNKEKGKVFVQTTQPDHKVLKYILDNNITGFYGDTLLERKQYFYPPYSRLFEITVISKDVNEVNHLAAELFALLKPHFGENLLGPEFPLISRIKNQYFKRILLKSGKQQSPRELRQMVYTAINDLQAKHQSWRYKVAIDVDPV
ncbi:MAG: primosomal protein N' [Bacteroidota bacterium]